MRLLLHAPQTTAGKLVQPRGRAASFRSSPQQLRLKPSSTHRIALRLDTSWESEGSFRRPVQASLDGTAPENAEAVAREQILEKVKAESASAIDAEQEPFRSSVESGQTIGEATTQLQFEGVGLAKRDADDQIRNINEQLVNQQNDKSSEEDGDPKAEVSSEVWGSKADGGNTHAFLDDETKVDFHGQENDSVLGIGGQRAE